VYRAARDEARVGGDFYDVFRMGDGKIGIAIGDVSGKGLQAAVQMAMAKYSLRSRAYESDRPSTVMEQVNKALVQDMGDESFVTIFAGVLDPKAMTVTYANAGHSPAILWKAAERQAVLLDSTGPVVGIMDDMTYQDETVQLQPGDELLLGTDGLFEVRCKEAFLEIEGLLGLYTGLRQSGVYSATGLVDRVIEFCQGELRDDVAILRVTVVE
jgi:sigma-B regulation protein RsbU (phosphoserine phosphatase)